MNLSAFVLPLCPLLALSVAAQDPSPRWERLKSLAPGLEVRVASIASRKSIQGILSSVTESEIVLMRGSHSESVSRPEIVRVAVRQKTRHLRNTLIGAGVGTAAGVLIAFAIGHAEASNCRRSGGWFCELDEGFAIGIGGTSGFLSGTAIGALWHTGRWTEVYVR